MGSATVLKSREGKGREGVKLGGRDGGREGMRGMERASELSMGMVKEGIYSR